MTPTLSALALDGDLLAALGEVPATRIAVLNDAGAGVAAALQTRHDCTISLVDLTPEGGFPAKPSSWIATCRKGLIAAGIPANRIEVISKESAIKPWDIVLNLDGFGVRHGVRALSPILQRGLHADSLLATEIRKGSGAFPFLKERGACETIGERHDGRASVARVLFRPNPPAPLATDENWASIATDLAGADGFFRDGGTHSFLFVPRSTDTLVVTFDNLDIAMTKREERRPWGYEFIEKQGWSMLGVMAGGWTWYRDPWVHAEFDRLREEGFFTRFARVVFYGASMGGYAAAAFAPASPGADVVAISPQSTLDRRLVPWETRYRAAWGYDYSGPYGDAAAVSAAAGRVFLFYDPYARLDAAHADRFTGANVEKLRVPLVGHRLGTALQQMGILSPVILAALDGKLTPLDFYRRLRARHTFPRYQWELFQRALDRGRPGLARRVGRWVLKNGGHPAIRRAMRDL
ncbi:MAG TPA: hypothetical protein PLI43_03510 [Albidovulum sp.]|uniref:hypothetical protein n=1 Tax=Albidovulum sp. TaxID=1872424 RepID=UPI002BE91D06|nr:hypothetical protein [Albidovulum sp.]